MFCVLCLILCMHAMSLDILWILFKNYTLYIKAIILILLR